MELRDGFMPLKSWRWLFYKFVGLSSLPLPVQTFSIEIWIGGCEENSLFYRQLFMVAWVIIWQSKLCFLWKKKKQMKTPENKYLSSHKLPAQGIYRVYPGGTLCCCQFRPWLLNLRAARGTAISFDQWIILCTTFRQIQALPAPQLSTFQPLHRQTSTSISVSGNKSKDKTLNNYNS